MTLDPKLKDYATDRQKEVIDAVIETGSQAAAARKLGVVNNTVFEAVQAVNKKAAAAGYAPNHFVSGVAPGFVMGKITVQRSATGEVERTWERQSPEDTRRLEAISAAFSEAALDLPRLKPIPPPASSRHDLCNLATFSDYHMGMMARSAETGADWNVEIAEAMLIAAFEDMIRRAPPAGKIIINIQGDFLHTDGLKPVTPTSGHILDADGSYSYMVKASVRVLRRLCDIALMFHGSVIVVFLPGNHDLSGQVWLRHMFAALYEHEPRLSVVDNETPYFVIEHGKNMLCFHHGHMKKPEALPLLFATRFAEAWGRTVHRVIHAGHYHHEHRKDFSGVRFHQHTTLAPADKHSSDFGYDSLREAICITYHDKMGRFGEVVVTPEMLAA
jgi:transposase-like protein